MQESAARVIDLLGAAQSVMWANGPYEAVEPYGLDYGDPVGETATNQYRLDVRACYLRLMEAVEAGAWEDEADELEEALLAFHEGEDLWS